MQSNMNKNPQNLTIENAAWDAFYHRMYNDALVYTRSKMLEVNSDKNSLSHEWKTSPSHSDDFGIHKLMPELVPNIEVVVVDPNEFYSSESEYSDSESLSDSDIDFENDLPHTKVSSKSNEKVQTNLPKLEEHLQDEKQVHSGTQVKCSEDVEPVEPIELIDGLFDFITLNTEEEDVLIREIESNDNSREKFDLAAYVTDQSETLESPHSIEVDSNQNRKKCSIPSMMHQLATTDNSKMTSNYNRRRNLKRQFLGDSSDSEEEMKKSKKRKCNDDRLWMPTEKPKTTAISSTKMQRKKKDENVPQVNGYRHGIGRGKDITTLSKYYKQPTLSDNSTSDKVEMKLVNSQSSLNKVEKNVNRVEVNVNKVQEQINVKLENNASVRKTLTKKPKVEEINNNAISEFEKAIADSMVIDSKKKANPSKCNKPKLERRRIQFEEHSVKFRQYLDDMAAKKAMKRSRLQETIHHEPVVSSETRKIENEENESRLSPPQQAQTTQIVNSEMVAEKKEASYTGTNVVMKRKITIGEYLKRKGSCKLPES